MTRHRLGRRNVQLVGCIAEDLLDGLSLRDVTDVGRRTMHVDVVDVLRFHASILQRVLHDEFGTQSLRMRGCDVVSVSTHARTNHFCVNLGTTSLGMLQFLKDKTASTLAHDETIAAGTERTAGLLRLVITRRQGVHGIETANTHLANGSLSATTYDDVGLAQANQVEGVSQCIA